MWGDKDLKKEFGNCRIVLEKMEIDKNLFAYFEAIVCRDVNSAYQ